MEKSKKTLAVSLSGVLVDSRPWKKAHEAGMKEHFENLGIDGVPEGENYFDVVERSIEKMWPDLSEEERIKKRRRIYFERVLEGIEDSDVNRDVVDFFRGLEGKYKLVLITTNDSWMAGKVLERIGCEELFEEVFVSRNEEKDDKLVVFERMLEKLGRVDYLVEESGKLEGGCDRKEIKYLRFEGLAGLREVLDGS